MDRASQPRESRMSGPARDWSQIGRRILDVARVATAVHLVERARRAEHGVEAEESPRV